MEKICKKCLYDFWILVTMGSLFVWMWVNELKEEERYWVEIIDKTNVFIAINIKQEEKDIFTHIYFYSERVLEIGYMFLVFPHNVSLCFWAHYTSTDLLFQRLLVGIDMQL